MASLIPYTKQQLVERIKRHIANGYPTSEFSISDREVLLYIDQAVAANMVGQVYALAKVEGNLVMPEAYLTTYNLSTLSFDLPSGYWYTTLPQPPVSLPLGYSINRVYATDPANGQSQEFLPIEAKRVGIRKLLPMPPGARYWVVGDKLWASANDSGSLQGYTMYAEMAKSRTESLTETMNMPDDAIEMVFNNVVGKLIQRMQFPKDIIQDDLPAGNKTS